MTMDHPDHFQQPPPPVPGGLLDMIERMMIEIENARQVPLSSSVMINQDEILDDLARIQAGLPEELRAARWMVREREAYIARTNEKARSLVADAKARSDSMIADAEARSRALVDESYIVQEAVEEANTLVRNAETDARRIRLEAEDFAERHLAEAEGVLTELLRYVREARAELHQTLPPQPEPPVSH